jgi:hypothetical protein
MEISFHKSGKKEFFLPWITLIGLSLASAFILYLGIYLIFYIDKKSFSDVLSSNFILFFYAVIWPVAILFNYKAKVLKVKHNGEVDAIKVKDYFINTNYKLIEQREGYFRLESLKRFDRFLAGSRYITIEYSPSEISIEMPSTLIYHVHHGFKFANSFTRN